MEPSPPIRPAERPKPKVLHLVAVDDSVRYNLANQLLWLREGGFDVHVACRPGEHAGYVRDRLGLPLHAVRISRRLNPFADLLAVWDLVRLFRRERFDVVHVHFPKPTLLGTIAARLARVPILVNTLRPVFQERTPALKRAFFMYLDRFTTGRSTHVLAQNPEDIERYGRLGVCPPARMSPLGNGIDLARFSPEAVGAAERAELRRLAGAGEGSFVVGMVGRYVREKGYEEFFAAVRRMLAEREDVRFLVAGASMPGSRSALPPELPERCGVAGRGALLGRREDMPAVYAAMDALLFPSRREAFPRAPMEAAAMGRPIVASDLRGCRRCVREGQNGFLVPPGDAELFARRALELAASPPLRERMGAASRRLALAEFDEREVFKRVAACYRKLLAARRRPAHALSFDVEDYRQIVLRDFFGREVPPGEACARMTRLVLGELRAAGVRATFFVTGSVAEAFPELVREIAAGGHELGLHGFAHRKCHELSPGEFRADLRRNVQALRAAAPGAEPRGYRAPAFSVVRESLWVPAVLKAEGLSYESSIFPVAGRRYGIPQAPRAPFRHPCGLVEVPLSTVRRWGRRRPAAGGGYLRLFPYAWTRRALLRLEREGLPGVVYMHPHEFDAGAPRPAPGLRPTRPGWRRFDFLQRLGRRRSLGKLRRLLRDFRFGPIGDMIAAVEDRLPTVDLGGAEGPR